MALRLPCWRCHRTHAVAAQWALKRTGPCCAFPPFGENAAGVKHFQVSTLKTFCVSAILAVRISQLQMLTVSELPLATIPLQCLFDANWCSGRSQWPVDGILFQGHVLQVLAFRVISIGGGSFLRQCDSCPPSLLSTYVSGKHPL